MRKNLYPLIFDICHCGKCNEIVYGGNQYINGHSMVGKYHSNDTKELLRQKTLELFRIKGHPRKGAVLSKETKEKIRKSVKKNWAGGSKKGVKKPKLSEVRRKLFKEGKLKGLKGDLNPAKRPEVREKISKTLIEGNYISWNKGLTAKDDNRIIAGKRNGMYGKSSLKSGIGKGCYYDSPLQGRIYLRSSYELAYAQYLDNNKILWYYEIETFELSNEMTYTPDFFLPQFEKFIEIKGYMLPKAKIKIDKFLEQYPFDLEILYRENLIKLGVKL